MKDRDGVPDQTSTSPESEPKPKCCCDGRVAFCMCLAKGIHGDGSGAIFDYSTGREIQLSTPPREPKSRPRVS